MIGTALCAAEHSEVSPCIIFCNPIKSLATIARCRDFLFQPLIEGISVPVGPMVLSGSTRLQATSALMFVVGGALSKALGLTIDTRELLSEMILFLEAPQYRDLIPSIIKESQWTKNRHPVHYHCTSFALILLNDTTERAPTFNMRPFENNPNSPTPLLTYIFFTLTITLPSMHGKAFCAAALDVSVGTPYPLLVTSRGCMVLTLALRALI